MTTPEAYFGVLAVLGAFLASGWLMRDLGERWRVPGVLPLMTLGVVARALGLIPDAYLNIAPYLSAAAFAVLLVRAGAALEPAAWPSKSRSGWLLWAGGLLPALVEWAFLYGFARQLLDLPATESALIAFLVSAVSPALLLPALLSQMSLRGGEERPLLLGLGAQVLGNALAAQAGILFILAALGAEVAAPSPLFFFLSWPLAIALGALLPRALLRALGAWLGASLSLAGIGLYFLFRGLGLESVVAVVAFVAMTRRGFSAEGGSKTSIPRVEVDLRRWWRVAEIPLFVNLGAAVDLGSLSDQEPARMALIAGLVVAAVFLRALVATIMAGARGFSRYARRHLVVAQIPRATVQAVFGLLAHRSLSSVEGQSETAEIVLLTALMAILLTAPAGSLLLEWAGRVSPPQRPGEVPDDGSAS